MTFSELSFYVVLVGVILSPLWLLMTGVPALLAYLYLFTPKHLEPPAYLKIPDEELEETPPETEIPPFVDQEVTCPVCNQLMRKEYDGVRRPPAPKIFWFCVNTQCEEGSGNRLYQGG